MVAIPELDKAAAANSLFGENMQWGGYPEIVQPRRGQFGDVLNKRTWFGIYVCRLTRWMSLPWFWKMCTALHMANWTDLTRCRTMTWCWEELWQGVREGYTKTGKPYGIAKVERLLRYWRNLLSSVTMGGKEELFMEGMFLFHEESASKQWKQEVGSENQQYQTASWKVKERVVEKLTVTAPFQP